MPFSKSLKLCTVFSSASARFMICCSFVAEALFPLSFFFNPMLLLLPLLTDDMEERRRFPSSVATGFHFLTGAGLGAATALTGSEEERGAAAAVLVVAETRAFCVGVTPLLSKDLVLVCAGLVTGLLAVVEETGFLV